MQQAVRRYIIDPVSSTALQFLYQLAIMIKLISLILVFGLFCQVESKPKFFNTVTNIMVMGSSSGMIDFTIPFFTANKGGEEIKQIKILQNGIVTLGMTVQFDDNFCLNNLNEVTTAAYLYIAPWWVRNTDGKVSYTIAATNLAIDWDDKQRIVDAISKYNLKYDHVNVGENDIDRVLFISWKNMINNKNVQRAQEVRNYFQLAIIVTTDPSTKERTAYAYFVYVSLDYDSEWTNGPVDSDCGIAAIMGYSDDDDDEVNSLNLRTSNFNSGALGVQYYSNIDDHKNLGNYIYKLSLPKDKQLKPPTKRNCEEPNEDPDVCNPNFVPKSRPNPPPNAGPDGTRKNLTLGERVQDGFCEFREAGLFAHPFFCNYFIYCGVDFDNARTRKCPNETNFNVLLGVCDWKVNLECNLPRNAIVIGKGFTSPIPQQIIHNNTCALLGWKDIPDPSSCDHFLACTNSRTIRMPCPVGLHFSNMTRNCKYPRDANCMRPKDKTTE